MHANADLTGLRALKLRDTRTLRGYSGLSRGRSNARNIDGLSGGQRANPARLGAARIAGERERLYAGVVVSGISSSEG